MMKKIKEVKYISLIEASRISKYSSDHLGHLIRGKKLGGKKIGRDWFTTEENLKTYLNFGKLAPVNDNSISGKPSFHFSVRQRFNLKPAILVGGFLLIISGLTFFLLKNSFLKINEPGDFNSKVELQKKEVSIGEKDGESLQEIQKLNITTYPSDDVGGVEISIQSEDSKKLENKK